MDKLDAHILLWILIAFCLGTLWPEVVSLGAARFTIDNEASHETRP